MKYDNVFRFLLTIIGFILIGQNAWAADLVIQNVTITDAKNYDSNGGIIFDNVIFNSTSNITSTSTLHVSIKPGTNIKTGGLFKVIMRDNDGLSNQCEMQYFGNLNQNPNDDPDGDQLNNLQECALGTDPSVGNKDNDADGLPDWWEVKYAGINLNTLGGKDQDDDGDGISNWVEYQIGSDPLIPNEKGPGIHYEYDALGRIIKIWRIPQK